MAQEVFLRVFNCLPGFRSRAASLEAWIRRIAFTTCLNQLRHEARRPELRWSDLTEEQAALVETLRVTDAAEEPAQRAAARDLVGRLLGSLPGPDRVLLELVDVEQRPMEEVCELTGWSRVNVRVRCFRARNRLRHALKRFLTDHENPS
jgi:RNA polymerase sigma-70 factor (ECF subfamily)